MEDPARSVKHCVSLPSQIQEGVAVFYLISLAFELYLQQCGISIVVLSIVHVLIFSHLSHLVLLTC